MTAKEVMLARTLGSGGGSGYTLPVASPTRLGGVKPEAATDEMSQPVGVDAAGKLFTAPGGDAEKTWMKVAEIQTTEDLTYISVTEDMNGNPLSFTEAIILPVFAKSVAETSQGNFVISVSPQWYSSFNRAGVYDIPLNNDAYALIAHARLINGFVRLEVAHAKRVGALLEPVASFGSDLLIANKNGFGYQYKNDFPTIYMARATSDILDSYGKLKGITIGVDMLTSVKLGAGTRLEIWLR